jgi:branched-chain amino acid transport system substrate-binding protein
MAMRVKSLFGILSVLSFLALPAQAELKIAAIGPMTGQDATMGEQMRRGVDAALAALNASGGLLGQKVTVIYKDDACDPKQGVAIANQLAGEKIAGVVGPMCSGVAIPVSKVLAEENLVMVSPSATNPLLTEQGLQNVFRVLGRDDQQGAAVGAYIAKHFAGKTIAIIHDKTAYGHGLADEVRKGLAQAKITPIFFDAINRGERDYSALIARIKDAGIEVVFFGGYHAEAGLLVRQLRDRKLTTQLIGGDGLTTSEFWSITGPAGEGTLMAFNPDPRKNPAAQEAVKTIRAGGFEPEGFTMQSHAAFVALTQAIARAGKIDGSAIAHALRTAPAATVLGPISFDAKGDVKNPEYAMYRWSGGTYHELDK